MIDLNVRVLTDLSLRFVDSLARHRGGILNVASVAGFMPGPGMAVYHATRPTCCRSARRCITSSSRRRARHGAVPRPGRTEFGVRPGGLSPQAVRVSASRAKASRD